jgi:nucleotide-binding universal stress UspA family protein
MKSILVHLDASARSAQRLSLAQRLAREHRAGVTAFYAVRPSLHALPVYALTDTAALFSVLEGLDREQRARARALFEHHAVSGPMTWAEIETEDFETALFERALLADLLVLGQTDPEDQSAGMVPTGFVAKLITDSGKPALVLPYAGNFEGVGHNVLVAWKPTREAARAATAALPWLRQAGSIHIACSAAVLDSQRVGNGAFESWLRLNGVAAPLVAHRLPDAEVGSALLSVAADTDADLLVMGCYGHSRAREWVLGGVTRTVLESMTLPVLMAH